VEDEDESRAVPFILQTYSKMYCSVARISLQHVWFLCHWMESISCIKTTTSHCLVWQ